MWTSWCSVNEGGCLLAGLTSSHASLPSAPPRKSLKQIRHLGAELQQDIVERSCPVPWARNLFACRAFQKVGAGQEKEIQVRFVQSETCNMRAYHSQLECGTLGVIQRDPPNTFLVVAVSMHKVCEIFVGCAGGSVAS